MYSVKTFYRSFDVSLSLDRVTEFVGNPTGIPDEAAWMVRGAEQSRIAQHLLLHWTVRTVWQP
jgi:hypothetical protein